MIRTIAACETEASIIGIGYEGDVRGGDPQRAAINRVSIRSDGRSRDGVNIVFDRIDERIVVLVDADEACVEIDTVIEEQQVSVGVNRRDCRGEIDQVRAASPGVVVAVSRLAKGGVDPVGIDMSGLRTCGRILQGDRCKPRRLSDIVSSDDRRA